MRKMFQKSVKNLGPSRSSEYWYAQTQAFFHSARTDPQDHATLVPLCKSVFFPKNYEKCLYFSVKSCVNRYRTVQAVAGAETSWKSELEPKQIVTYGSETL
jgi:hypothetical protein